MTRYTVTQFRSDAPAGMERGILRHAEPGEVLDVFVEAHPPIYAAVSVGGRVVFPRSATTTLGAATPRRLNDVLSSVRHRTHGEPRGSGDVVVEVWNASGEPAEVFTTILYRHGDPIEREPNRTRELRPQELAAVAAAGAVAAILFAFFILLGHP